ncbi:protein HEG homolog 1-like [Mustelus asterias]
MSMIPGVTLTYLICYIAIQVENSGIAATGTASTTELMNVTSMSPSNPTAVTGLQPTELLSTSKQNESTTSTPTSGTEGASVSSIVTISNTNLPSISTPNVTASPTENITSTTEIPTTLSNESFATASSPVTKTDMIPEASTTQTVATTEMPTNTTSNFTQTSTLDLTTISPTLHNASTSISATSGHINVPVSTVIPTIETSDVVTLNITSTSTSVTIINDTVPVTATVPMNATSQAMTQSTEVSSSTWTTAQSPKTSATLPADHCVSANCPPSSKCVNLFVSYKCQCPPGLLENEASCVTVRTFPGILHLKEVSFTNDMKEVSSKAFYDTATKIEKEVKSFFKGDISYRKSIVRKLAKGSVNAIVDNIFALSSNATEDSVSAMIKAGIENCSSCALVTREDTFIAESVCSQNPCDNSTSRCKANNGITTCNCLPGYFKFLPSDRSCKACLSGFKLENGTCVKCPFGYGGFNCDKSYLLAVVVISCVLGGILLLLLLALITTCLRSKSGSCSSSSGSHDYVMWPKSEMPKIPRATMHWDGNQLEMQENGSTSSLNEIHRDGGRTPEKNDDLKTFKGKQQSRYTYLCQGQENPYYVSDEKKPE